MSRQWHRLGVALAWLVAAGTAVGQSDRPPLLPPPPAESQPAPDLLPPPGPQPADPPADFCGPPKLDPVAADGCTFDLGTDGTEYLLWWLKSAPLPPLVTRNRSSPPVLGLPDTRVIAGGEPMNLHEFSGGRFTLGGRFGDANVGTEYTYFFLGTRTTAISPVTSGGNLGRPVIDAVSGAETFVPVTGLGASDGMVRVVSAARAQGVEANVVTNLFRGDHAAVTGLVGYRFLQIHEGVSVGQSGVLDAPGGPVAFGVSDQIDGHNRFHGGQLGLRADARHGPLFVELGGKIAFGQTTEVVKVGGLTGLSPSSTGNPLTPGGVLAVSTNSGRLSREVFAVVPEANFKVGFQYENHRAFVGYDFTYLSSAVRPGDQIDRTVNFGQVPLFGGSGSFTGPERPQLAVKSTDFWLQGLIIGMETRW